MILEVGLNAQSLTGGSDAAAQPVSGDFEQDSYPAPQDILKLVLERLDDEQANDVVPIELDGKSDVADAMVIASGRSQRHVGAIADKLARDLKEAGMKNVAVEGLPACDWVLIDSGDVIIHVFRPEVRSFYNLERIWAPELFSSDAETSSFAPATDAFEVADVDAATDDEDLED